ncbi:MAG TPA: hypothetical protein VMP67_05615 [Candidatus Limnocylindria bacterium]|nr:hypothetical protein [Candidatus Limnocylindria bacterium]
MRTMVVTAILVLAACSTPALPTVAPAISPGLPPTAAPLPAQTTGAATPAAGRVEQLGPSTGHDGERMFTLGETATVENVSTLTLRGAERGDGLASMPSPAGQTTYTFLVSFAWDGTTPGPISVGSSYYNAINFSLRDDEGFEYPVIQGAGFARQPELLFGYLAAGQQVQGWVTFYAPAEVQFVELTYRPIADDSVFFRVEPAG